MGGDKFSVAWCQPVGFDASGWEEWEGSVVVSASSIQNNALHDLTFITDFCLLGGFLNTFAAGYLNTHRR